MKKKTRISGQIATASYVTEALSISISNVNGLHVHERNGERFRGKQKDCKLCASGSDFGKKIGSTWRVIPSSLISDLRTQFPEKPEEEIFFYFRSICRVLADAADDATCGNGEYLPEPSKIKRWLRESANQARRVQSLPAPIANSEVAGSQPAGRLAVNADSGRPPQPHATCPNCPHAVHGTEPCPETLGAGRGCGCQGSEGA